MRTVYCVPHTPFSSLTSFLFITFVIIFIFILIFDSKIEEIHSMKRNTYILIRFLIPVVVIAGTPELYGQRIPDGERLKSNSDMIVRSCYAGNNPTRIYVPPPEAFYKTGEKSKVSSTITVRTYDFPIEAKAAFLYAAAIWSSLLNSPVDINIAATWSNLGEGTLGSTYLDPSKVVRGSDIGAPEPDALYPYPIAEKMAGKELNDPDAFEIEIVLNSDQDWYFGTDGETPIDKFDLASVSLHEMCHGLGFYSTMEENNGNGYWGYFSGLTIYFDHFIRNGGGQQLINTDLFENGSVALLDQYESENLYFSSPIARSVNSGLSPMLYAPIVFNPGSSISHLDEDTYPGATQNALMTPFVNRGQAIHDPGPIVMAMFAEIGWIHTYIEHDTLMDVENMDLPFTVTASITSDTSITSDGGYIFYSTDSFTTYDSIMLAETGNPDEYTADIPVSDTGIHVSYYLTVTDYFDRVYRNPATAPEINHRFFVGKDLIKPVIGHEPVLYMLLSQDSLRFRADVRDNLGIDSVYIDYLINETAMDPIRLPVTFEPTYQGYLNFEEATLAVGDTISYRITAVDASVSGNTTTIPDSGYYSFRVEKINDPVDAYENDFNGAADDFLKNGFNIDSPASFTNPALHTRHPYEQTGESEKSIEYEAILTYPIILKETDAWMAFDEIVLVEPGETGTVFGDYEFWDYVIVEGSKDTGSSWHPLFTGYDSRINTLWFSTYNSTLNEGNSEAFGAANMYRERMINLLAEDEFNGGDDILIRFRLYSDAFAYGWGWAIDNIRIQGDLSGTGNDLFMDNDIRVFPNPVSGIFTIEGRVVQGISQVNVILTDILGRALFHREFSVTGETFRERIDLSGNEPGIYLITVSSGDKIAILKIIKSD